MGKNATVVEKKINGKGQVIYIKESDNSETWFWYHDNGKLDCKHHKSSDGVDSWEDYDKNGKLSHFKDSTGNEKDLADGKIKSFTYVDEANGITKKFYR